MTALLLAAFLPGCLGGSEQPASNSGEKTVVKASDQQPAKDSPPEVTAPAPESVAAAETSPRPELTLPKLSPGLPEVIRLAQAQVGESVVLAYINKSAFAFNPSLEEILYLHDVGISEPVLTAILNRSRQQTDATAKLAEAQAAMTNSRPVAKAEIPALNPAPTITAPPPTVEPAPAPAQVVVQPVVYSQPVVISQPVFYNELSPYGTWIEVGGYGRCWQPTVAVVDLGWRPYHHRGRWLDTDAGWYWQSDYSWGWAPFHYGRWHQDRSCGWVWVPGNTWAPAWVSWRSSNNYCGWAPLPPAAGYGVGVGFSYHQSRVGVNFEFGLSSSHYTFVPIDRFCDRNPRQHFLPANQVTTVYQQTTIVNNYVTGNNNTVINHGVDHRAVVAASRTEIQKVAIRDTTAENARRVQPDRLVREGSSIAIFRPQMASLTPSSTATPAGRTEQGSAPAPSRPSNSNPAGITPRRDGGPTKPATVSSLNPPATESRTLTVPNGAPKALATPATVNSRPTPSLPLAPLVPATPKSPTVSQPGRLEQKKDAREPIASRQELERPELNRPPVGGQTTSQPAFKFQAPKVSSPATQPQLTVPTLLPPAPVATPAPVTLPSNRPRLSLPEPISRPEVQRPAPPARNVFQVPAAPSIQPSAPAPSIPQPSRPQNNSPAPASPPPSSGPHPSRPAVVAPPPASPAPSRPQPAAPAPGNGNDQRRPEKRNP